MKVRSAVPWLIALLSGGHCVRGGAPRRVPAGLFYRKAAAAALGNIGDQRAVGPLIQKLSMDCYDAQHEVIWALQKLKNYPRAKAALRLYFMRIKQRAESEREYQRKMRELSK